MTTMGFLMGTHGEGYITSGITFATWLIIDGPGAGSNVMSYDGHGVWLSWENSEYVGRTLGGSPPPGWGLNPGLPGDVYGVLPN